MEVRSTEVQNNFGTYLKYAQFEDVYITRNGKRVGVLQGYGAYQVAEGKPAYDVRPEITLEEFLDFVAKSSERYELIDGEVFRLGSPSLQHQEIVLALGSALRDWSRATQCKALVAPFDVLLEAYDKTNVVQPDVVVICDLENIDEAGRYRGIPTIVVEVLSETSRSRDMVKKLELYGEGGITEYWIVNPFTEEVYIYTFAEEEIQDYRVYTRDAQIGASVLAGLKLAVSSIFS